MGPQNLNPLDELKSLDQQVELVNDLAGLKPIFFRLDEIAKQNANDFEVQLAVGDIKQHLVNRGTRLKQMKGSPTEMPSATSPGESPAGAPPPRVATPPPLPPGVGSSPGPPPLSAPPPAGPPPLSTDAPRSAPPPVPEAPVPVQSAGGLPPIPSSPSSSPAPPPPAPSTTDKAPPSPLFQSQGMPAALPPELKPPKKLMSSGQFTKPTPLTDTGMTPRPTPPAMPPVKPSEPGSSLTSGVSEGPIATTENASAAIPPVMGPPPVSASPASGPPRRPAVPPKTPSQPPKPPLNWKRALWVGALAGAVIAIIGIAALVNVARKRNLAGAAGQIQLEVATTPAGASVRINGETKCVSDCKVTLPPGNYQVTAFLDGYEPAAGGVTLAAGQPASVNLALEPQAQSLRILTDLDSGKVTVDNQPPADLHDGQFIVDRIPPGPHTVKLVGKTGEASFSFEIAPARLPVITGTVMARNLNAALVASMGNQARVMTSSGPIKLAVNGQAEADSGPAGVDLKNFQAGVDELVIGEGKDQRSVKENFGPAPMLTAFLKSDLNIGTLIVSTGEDGVRVFLNNREYRARTQRGQVRIQTIGNVSVRVMKEGFDSPAVQTAEVKKGAETRLEFTLKAAPQVATLQINGGTPGAEVLIDQKNVGTIGQDGNFNDPSVNPGDHTIELRREQFVTRRFQRSFKVGQAITLSGADVVLAAERIPPPPAEKKTEPPPPPPKPPVTPPAPKAGTMADWEDNSVWRQENGAWVHKGAGFLSYKLPPKGIFTFTVQLVKGGGIFRGGRIRWALQYLDNKNYALYELDNKNFWAKVVMNGKTFERTKTALKDLEKQKSFTIQIDVTPEHIVHKMFSGGEWMNLDSWAEPGRNFSEGKFGFLVQGNDEIGLNDFKFEPK